MNGAELWDKVLVEMKDSPLQKSPTPDEERDPEEVIIGLIGDKDDKGKAVDCLLHIAYCHSENAYEVHVRVEALSQLLTMMDDERNFVHIKPILIRELYDMRQFIRNAWDLDKYSKF